MADVYEIVTEEVIRQLEEAIEKGGNAPWQKPWTGVLDGAYNRITKRPYSFLNQILLGKPGEYASFNQWKKIGGHLKKDCHSSKVVFWKCIVDKKTDEETGEEIVTKHFMLRYYNVFHVDDVIDSEGNPFSCITRDLHKLEHIESAEDVVKSYEDREHIYIKRTVGSNRAFYSPSLDFIQVPMLEQFSKANEFYGTLFHEMVHSTGHSNRLARFNGMEACASFGSESYSKEELVAECGSAMLLGIVGINSAETFNNNVAYLESWLNALKNDKKLIVSAAGKAQKAVEYILGVELTKGDEENE